MCHTLRLTVIFFLPSLRIYDHMKISMGMYKRCSQSKILYGAQLAYWGPGGGGEKEFESRYFAINMTVMLPG